MATTSLTNTFKQEMLQAGHCFNATMSSLVGAGVNATFTITGLAATAGVAVGMAAGGTNVAAGAIVASIDSATQVTVSKAHTGTVTSGTISFTADVFKAALIKVTPTGTYNNTLSNYGAGSGTPSVTNIGTDEASGAGYTAGGVTLVNITPATATNTAFTQFTTNPSWTSATFSTTSMVVYNSSSRLGGTAGLIAGRTVGNYDFGGTQTVTAGTFTVLQPVNGSGTALIQVA
jgi:hypothetical protein